MNKGKIVQSFEEAVQDIQDRSILIVEGFGLCGIPEEAKVLIRLFNLLQQNGRKSHRYEKKTVFNILSVVYEYTMNHRNAA